MSTPTPAKPSTVQQVWSLLNLALGIAGSFYPEIGRGVNLAEDLLAIAQQALKLHSEIANVPIEEVISKLHPVVPPSA